MSSLSVEKILMQTFAENLTITRKRQLIENNVLQNVNIKIRYAENYIKLH